MKPPEHCTVISALQVLCTGFFNVFSPASGPYRKCSYEAGRSATGLQSCELLNSEDGYCGGWWDMYEFTVSDSRPGWHGRAEFKWSPNAALGCTLWLMKGGWQFGFSDAAILHVTPLGRSLHVNRTGLCCMFLCSSNVVLCSAILAY